MLMKTTYEALFGRFDCRTETDEKPGKNDLQTWEDHNYRISSLDCDKRRINSCTEEHIA